MVRKPLISVLMTAYNREKYIAEAIQSIQESTYDNWELIITDDCSVDNTLAIARSFANADSRIRVYKNTSNLGDYPNRNKAASYAIGDFLMSVDSDDKLLPDSMQKCLELFHEFPEANFGIYSPDYNAAQLLTPDEIISRHFFNSPLLLVGPGGSIIKNNYFKLIDGFPVKYGPANDGYYNLKAASQASTIIFPFEFIFYRRHDGQEINNKYGYLYNNYLFLRDALNELTLPLNSEQRQYLIKKNKRRFLVNIIRYYLKSRNWSKTIYAFKQTDFKYKDILIAVFH